MKYFLIEVIERDISTPELFDTFDDALDRMCEYIAEVCDVPKEDIKESYLQGEEFNSNTCVTGDVAWIERHGVNFDWKIFKFEEETGCVS